MNSKESENCDNLQRSTMFTGICAYVSFVGRKRYVERLHKKVKFKVKILRN